MTGVTARVSYDQPVNCPPRLTVALSDGYTVCVVIEPDCTVGTAINQLHECVDMLQRHMAASRG